MWPGVSVDDLGEFTRLEVDPELYGEEVVFKTAYWFTDRLFIYLTRTDTNNIGVELRPKPGADSGSLPLLCGEFCNSLIDFAVRQQVLRETSPIREALIRKAFSESRCMPGLPTALSDESFASSEEGIASLPTSDADDDE